MIEERMTQRAESFWLDDRTTFLDIQSLTYNAHQVTFQHELGVSNRRHKQLKTATNGFQSF